jgi:hypothetical protein
MNFDCTIGFTQGAVEKRYRETGFFEQNRAYAAVKLLNPMQNDQD